VAEVQRRLEGVLLLNHTVALSHQSGADLQRQALVQRIEIDQSGAKLNFVAICGALARPRVAPGLGEVLALLRQPVRPVAGILIGEVVTEDERAPGSQVPMTPMERLEILLACVHAGLRSVSIGP